ncbi:MAG: FtsX-like permease family protein [Micrococcaceae bacterium]
MSARDGSARSIAARLSWRELRRHRWRSVLIIALIGLPVLAMTLQSITTASTASTPQRQIENQLYGTDGVLQVDSVGAAAYVNPSAADLIRIPHPGMLYSESYFADRDELEDPYMGGFEGAGQWWDEVSERADDFPAPAGSDAASLAAALPETVTLHPVTEGYAPLDLGNEMTMEVSVIIADLTDPALAGRFIGVDDAVPTEDTVTVSRSYAPELERRDENAAALDRDPVGEVSLAGHPLTIGGTTVDRQGSAETGLQTLLIGDQSFSTVFVHPDSQLAEDLRARLLNTGYGTTTYYLTGDVPTDYASYLNFHEAGVGVLFRPVAENPPAETMQFGGTGYDEPGRYASILFLGTLALVETGLLAGAAFAVGARSQQRTTAMLSAVGASPATVRSTMGLSGLWCGLIGAVGGAVVGIAVAYALWAVGWAQLLVFEPPTIPWWIILATVVIGVVVSVVAAWIPARAVAAQDAWSAIKGGARERRGLSTPVRVAGLILVGSGLLVLVVATAVGMSIPTVRLLTFWVPALGPVVVLAGIMLIVGVLLLIPTVLHGLARFSSRLPWTLRIAARDADRNRSRTVPITVAMVAAACLGAATLSLTGSSLNAYETVSSADAQRPSGAHLGVLTLTTDVEREMLEHSDREAGIDTEAEGYDDGLVTHTPAEARAAVEAAARTAGLQLSTTRFYSQVVQDCLSYGVLDCEEIHPLTPQDSDCALPVPDDATLTERYLTLDRAIGERTRSQAAACSFSGYSSFSLYGSIFGASMIAVTDLDEPSPTELWGDDPEVTAAYERGQAVVLDPTLLSEDGTVTLGRFDTDLHKVPGLSIDDDAEDYAITGTTEPDGEQVLAMSPLADQRGMLWEPKDTASVPAVVGVAPAAFNDIGVVVPQDRIDWADPLLNPNSLVVRFTQEPTDEQWELFSLALEQDDLWVSPGDSGPNWVQASLWIVAGMVALLVLTAAGILAGLAMADSRRDHRALDSTGAAPSARKTMAAAQMFTSMAVSLVLGTVAGVLPFAAMQLITDLTVAWIPWWQLLALTVALPVVAAGVTWLVTPARFYTSRASS